MFTIRHWLRRPDVIIVVTGIAIGLAFWFSSTRPPPIPHRPLRIGFEHNPPVQIRTASGFEGLAVETVREAAKRAGISLQWVETGTSSDEAFQKGLVDLWPLMADLPERRKRLHITRAWLHSTHALLLPPEMENLDRGFTGRIAYFKLPLHARLLREQFPDAEPVDFPRGQEAVRAVCTGAASAAFLEGRAAVNALREKPRECDSVALRVHPLPKTTIQLGVASTFEAAGAAEKLRNEITTLYRAGTLAILMAKYSYYGLEDTWSTYELMETAERLRWMYSGIAALTIALAITLWQAWALRRARQVAERANVATSLTLSRYELVARATNDALFECDIGSGTVTWNEAVQKLFRYAPDQVGSDVNWWKERVHPADEQRVLNGIASALARGAPTWSDEYRFRCGDGSYASVVDRGYLLYDGGKPVSMVRAIMDVTPRRILEEQLRQSQKMEAIGRLAGGIAHDFNNLLTVINGYSDWRLQGLDPGSPVHKALSEINQAGRKAAGLTQQLLAFSRKQILQTEVLDLNAVIVDSAAILRRLIGEDVDLVLNLEPSLGSVRADASQIHRILVNLAVNARDAMPAGGKLILSSANVAVEDGVPELSGVPPGPYVRITVTDTGSGMNAEVLSHLFEPFFTTKEPGKGTGLGLSIVYGIVSQSGGVINVSSKEDQGTSVRILLPRIDASVTTAETPKIDVAALRGSETVLLVEDDPLVREMAAVILKESGYQVLEALDVDHALRLGQHHQGAIHVLLTDVLMPGMTGYALEDRLRPIRPEMSVVYMSGYADRQIVLEAMKRSGALFLQKPFSPATLGGKLREALHRRPALVLVVDDDAPTLGFVRQVLQEAGYYVVTAANGKEAMSTIRMHEVDLVITDLAMPEQEGIETIQALRRDFPALNIVAMSGAFGNDVLKVARHLGARATLRKPVAPGELLSVVREVLKDRGTGLSLETTNSA